MSPQANALVAPATSAPNRSESGASSASAERQGLERLASEFESMMMVQVLRDMRRAGKWDEQEGGNTLGAKTLFEMLDAELASVLTKAQGFGLAKQMLEAFDRRQGSAAPAAAASVVPTPAAAPLADTHQPGQVEQETGDRPEVASDAPQMSRHAGDGAAAQITSAFGWRRDPITGETRFHRGVDLRAAYGQDVQASADGRVVFSGSQGSYGTTVLLEHANGTRTRYAHLSVALAKAGEAIGTGQLVGRAGSSGRATGPHVHVEVLDRNGTPIDPTSQGPRP